MITADLSSAHDVDQITILRKLLPLHRTSLTELQNLIVNFSDAGMKNLFIHFCQMHDRCLKDLEDKIKLYGLSGDWEKRRETRDSEDFQEESHDPVLHDRSLLLRCIHGHMQILQTYVELRRGAIPFDLRMLLQRHQLQVRDTMERLSALYLSYPAQASRLHALECAA